MYATCLFYRGWLDKAIRFIRAHGKFHGGPSPIGMAFIHRTTGKRPDGGGRLYAQRLRHQVS